jgi:small subunit ribosomal protein S1
MASIVGTEVEGLVLQAERHRDRLMLSPRHLAVERAKRAQARQRRVTANVFGANRGGLLLDVFGLLGFVPRSEMSHRDAARFREFVGDEWRGFIVDVYAQRLTASAWPGWRRRRRSRRRARFIDALRPGQQVRGVVTEVHDFGAFICLNPSGTIGLVNRKDLAWGWVGSTSDVVQPGDRVRVAVLDVRPIQREAGQTVDIDLSLRALQPNPYEPLAATVARGAQLSATVTAVTADGALVRPDDHPEIVTLVRRGSFREGAGLDLRVQRIDVEHGRLHAHVVERDGVAAVR